MSVLDNIKKWIKETWLIKDSVEMSTLPCEIILFEFNQEEDLELVLENGPWWFGKSRMHIKK